MISKRTLMKWRREALWTLNTLDPNPAKNSGGHSPPKLEPLVFKSILVARELAEHVLKLTQVLIDQHLLVK